MAEFLTSDIHLGHGNIIMYCKRPWLQEGDTVPGEFGRDKWVSREVKEARTAEMNKALVADWNATVDPGDTVKHLGDFCFSRGRQEDATYWESKLNGNITHFKGNHDHKREIKGMMKWGVMTLGPHECFLSHRPPGRIEAIPEDCNVALCGHVHEAWDHKWVGHVLVVNVGVDVRGFRPWRTDLVVGEIDRLLSKGR
jgi:calcineurin-like phosphoesterase family protein